MSRATYRLMAAALAASTCLPATFARAADEGPLALAAGPNAEASGLRRFAAGPDALTFGGENGARDIPFYVSADETAGSAKLLLSLQSAVSDLPEASEMSVLVNDRPIGKTRLGAQDSTELAFDLPTGLLQPGFNAVSIIVNQAHRVDCSIPATYELWTRIDPSRSGIMLAGAQHAVRDFADLAGIDRNAAGEFVIRGRVAPDASVAAIEQTLSAVQSFVVAADIDRPRVEFNEFAGTGPGLDIVVGGDRGALSAESGTGLPFLSLDPGAKGTRPALFISGGSPEEIAANLAQFAGYAAAARMGGSAEGLRAISNRSGRRLDAGERVDIASLGFRETNFAGRYYNDRITFSLPPDFYAADYGDAAIYLDASYAPNLLKSAQFMVRANGAIVSTLGLSSFRGGTLSGQRLPIPLSKLRPGRNVVSFEAILPTAADETCDAGVATGRAVPRLFVSGTTAIEIPTLARIGHAPDVAAMTAGLSQVGQTQRIAAVIPTPAGPSLDAAGTFFATMAASADKVLPVDILTAVPPRSAGEMIAFGTISELPTDLLAYVGLRERGGLPIGSAAPDGSSGPASDSAGLLPFDLLRRSGAWLGITPAGAATPEPAGDFPAKPFDLSERLSEMREGSAAFGRHVADWAWQMVKPSEAEERAQFEFTDATALAIAQRPAPHAAKAAWTVVTAQSDAELLAGVASIADPDRWVQLGGAISALSRETGGVSTVQARSERIYETQPRSLANGRLVLAGWFSRHVERYVLGILAAFLLLGLSTHLFVRNVGGRNK